MSIKDFLGDISGYRPLYLSTLSELNTVKVELTKTIDELNTANEKIRQLELLAPRSTPPVITYIAEKDDAWVQQEIDSMNLGIIRHKLDNKYRLTNKSNFFNIIAWDFTDKIPYIKEKFDCENFAILFKSVVDLYFGLNQVGIVIDYKSAHSYNLVMFDSGNHHILEPMSDGLYLWTQRVQTFYPLSEAIVII